MPRKRGVARYLRDYFKAGRLPALRQSPRSGVGSDEGARRKEKNPDAKRAGTEETGLFEMVNRKRRGRRIGQRLERHRVSGNALVSRPSARLGAPFARGASSRARAGTQGPHDVLPLGPGSRGVYPRAARSADPGARPGHESGARPRARLLAAHCVGPAQSLHRQRCCDCRAGEPCARNCRISSTRSSSRSGC
jgi:hypothetical protein